MSLFLKPDTEVKTVGRVFGTPLVVVGNTWLPLMEVMVWAFMTWIAGKRRPARPWWARLGVGFVTMPFVIGSEWLHNFSHAAAAQLVGRPMDALRITWGTPLVIYYDLEGPDVTPRQHIIRSAGGPIFNLVAFLLSLPLRRRTHPDSVARDIANAITGMNLLTVILGMGTPLTVLDGGPVLKWSLVEMGRTPAEADRILRRLNLLFGLSMLGFALAAFRRRQWLAALLLAQFGVLGLLIGAGVLKA